MKITLALAGAFLLAAPMAAYAANAAHPYSNVDHRNDAGNNTGDSQVDRLNAQQLQSNGQPGQTMAASPSYQPQAYYPGQSYYAPSGNYTMQPAGTGY